MMISSLLLERLWLLAALLVMVEAAFVAVWLRRRGRLAARAVWIGLLAMPALLLLNHFTVTPRERIINLCCEMAKMVDEGNVGAVGEHWADDFSAAGLNRSQFLERARERLTEFHVDHSRLSGFDVTFPRDGTGVAVFDAACRVSSPNAFQNRLLSRWRVTFRGRSGSWKVTRIEAVPTPLSPIRNLRDWIH